MLSLKPILSHRFEGAIDLSDLPSELHAGLKRYADQFACESDGERGRLVAIDFEGAASDSCPEAVVRAMLEGNLASSAGRSRTPPFEWSPLDESSYAAHLLAARYLKTRLGNNVVFRDRVALRA